MRYDVPLKQLFHAAPQRLLRWLTGCEAVEILNSEYPSVKARRPDLVARLSDGRIHHLELQSHPDPRMAWRMLEYCALIAQSDGPPFQQVLYVGNGRPRFNTRISLPRLEFSYELRDIRDIDCGWLLQSPSLEDNLLALLCRLDNPSGQVRDILSKITGLENNAREDALVLLANLAGLRKLQPVLDEEMKHMSLELSLKDNLFLRQAFEQGNQEGRQEGRQEGEAHLLCRLLEKRFGKLSARNQRRVMRASLAQIEQWSERLLTAGKLADVLDE